MISRNILNLRLNWDLDMKILWAKQRIKEFHIRNNGNVYISFSGGKDSTVLLHLVRSIYPDIEGVFADTGLEYPEIREFVSTQNNITSVRPAIPFTQVIKKYGYPVISKNVSRYVRDLQNPTPNNKRTRDTRLGLTNSVVGKLSKKWMFLVDAPFKCSEQCCEVMKKAPMRKYQRTSKKFPIIGTMVGESMGRRLAYMKSGCFNENKNQLIPMAIFTEQDIWDYIKKYKLKYSKIYDMGEKRTGCMFCMFGIQYDDKENDDGLNRFQRMKISHPKLHKYCMNQLKIKEVLDFIKIKSE